MEETTWESEYYNNSTFRGKADLIARVLEGDDYNDMSYCKYYCTGNGMPSFDSLDYYFQASMGVTNLRLPMLELIRRMAIDTKK